MRRSRVSIRINLHQFAPETATDQEISDRGFVAGSLDVVGSCVT